MIALKNSGNNRLFGIKLTCLSFQQPEKFGEAIGDRL